MVLQVVLHEAFKYYIEQELGKGAFAKIIIKGFFEGISR